MHPRMPLHTIVIHLTILLITLITGVITIPGPPFRLDLVSVGMVMATITMATIMATATMAIIMAAIIDITVAIMEGDIIPATAVSVMRAIRGVAVDWDFRASTKF